MTVKELREKLEAFDDSLTVYVYADHGQDCACAEAVTEEWAMPIDDDAHRVDPIDPDDVGTEYDEDDLIKVVVIDG